MSELRVDSIKNQNGTGSPTFTGLLEAGGFRVSGSTGFLKSDGTVDTNTYLSSTNVGNGKLTFSVSGTGLSLSTSPEFNANQSSDKTINITLSSSASATANTLVSRDIDSNTAVNLLTATTVTSDTVNSKVIKNTDRIYAYSTNAPTSVVSPVTSLYETPYLNTAVAAQFGVGVAFLIAADTIDPAAIEFYKTRNAGDVTGHKAVFEHDAIGAIHFSASDGTNKRAGGSIACQAARDWNTTIQPTQYLFLTKQYINNSSAPLRDTMHVGLMLNTTDTIGPTTITLPYVKSTSQSANASFDASNRLVRQSSSIKYKTNVEEIEDQYAYNALKLRPVWYRSKADADNQDWSWYGLIAEEVAEVEPRLTFWGYDETQYDLITHNDGSIHKKLKKDAKLTPEGVQYDRIPVLLLKIVKDQQKKIEELESKINSIIN
jgi:hypothetical protein